ncbi:MAG: hypothetical protein HOE53_04105 [Candidatus Magasanikbacteria bacterium]|jgi:hypothetical protein|nr:hypothetical protein [Candidatus Magasanikbacteria bacterium]
MASDPKQQNLAPLSALLYIAGTVLFFAFAVWSMLFQFTSAANPPDIITYQGKLFSSGSAVTTSVAMKFIIYDAAGGGSAVYSASGTTAIPKTLSVTPSSGIFSVDLGGSGTTALDNSIFADNAGLYLEVVIENTTLTPRKQLTASPYAINSRYLMGYGAATSATATAYIPVSDSNGAFTFRGAPSSSAVGDGVIYINPYAADVAANETLFAAAVGGTEKFRVDEDGDTWVAGDIYITGTSTVATTTINGSLTVTSTNATGDLVHVRTNGTSRLVLTAGGNFGINTSSPAYALSVVGSSFFTATGTFPGLTIGSGGSGGSIDLNGTVISDWSEAGGGGDVVAANSNTFTNENTFSSTTNFTDTVNMTGGVANITQVGTLTDGVNLNGLGAIEVVGDYVFGVSASSDNIVSIDISSSTNPLLLDTLSDGGDVKLNQPEDIDVVGNYAYVASGLSAAMEIVDISNPANLVHIGALTGIGDVSAIQVEGAHAYLSSGNSDTIYVVNVADPANPYLEDSMAHAGGAGPLLDNIQDIAISGRYLFAVSSFSDALSIIDISNPADLQHVTSTLLGTTLNTASSIEIEGKHAYIGTADGTPSIEVVDISDVRTPSTVESFTGVSGVMRSFVLSRNYIYALSGLTLDIIDISNPEALSVTKSQSLGAGSSAQGNRAFALQGNKLYYAGLSDDRLEIWNLAGADIANVEIGTMRVSNLIADREATFDSSVRIKNSLSVGNRGIYTSGDIVLHSNTTTPYATTTIRFSQTGQFISFASTTGAATTDTAFIFDTKNTYTSATTSYLLSVRNAGSAVFSVSANGDVQANGTYYGAGANVGVPGQPGDLAERVDVRPDQSVEPGDVMIVDPEDADTYMKSTGAYASAVAGVVSTKPTITVGNGRTAHTALLALIGRVPVKISNENGPVERGDLLVAATLPGHAMKYDPLKDDGSTVVGIIGLALDSFEGEEETGKIMSLVKSGWVHNRMQSIAKVEKDLVELANEVGVNVNIAPDQLAVVDNGGVIAKMTSDLDMNGYYIRNVAGIDGSEHWAIDDQGRFVTTVETNGEETALYALQSEQTELVFSGSDELFLGRTKVKFTEEMQALIDTDKPMKISVTLTEDAKGIFVDGKGPLGFNVRELDEGTSHATFDWVLIAHRKIDAEEEPVEEEPAEEEEEHDNEDFWFIFGDEDPDPEPDEAPVEEEPAAEEPENVEEPAEEPEQNPEAEEPAEEPVIEEPVEEPQDIPAEEPPAPEEVPAVPEEAEPEPVEEEVQAPEEQPEAIPEEEVVEPEVIIPEPEAPPAEIVPDPDPEPAVEEIAPEEVEPEPEPAPEEAPVVEELPQE